MKRDSLKIGARSKSKREQFTATFNSPETLAECVKLAGGNEAAVVARFTRGLRIWLQDAIGRPLFEAGASAADIQAALDNAKLGVTKALGRPKVQPTASIPTAKQLATMSKDQLVEHFAKQGIKVVIE